MTRDEDLFTDDTDIFADIPKPREKETKKKKKTTTATPKKTIFKDDIGIVLLVCFNTFCLSYSKV